MGEKETPIPPNRLVSLSKLRSVGQQAEGAIRREFGIRSGSRLHGPVRVGSVERFFAFLPHPNARRERSFQNVLMSPDLQRLRTFLLSQEPDVQAVDGIDANHPNPYRFQKLLEDYPDLLAGDQMSDETPRCWLLVSREDDVPDQEDGAGRWSLDHLFLDQDGIPTLAEVKRSSEYSLDR